MLSAAALLLTAVLACTASDEKSSEVENAEILAKSLRRQLMKDNYDYISYESKEPKWGKATQNRRIYRNEEMEAIDTKNTLNQSLKSGTERTISNISEDKEIIKNETSVEYSSMELITKNHKQEIHSHKNQQRQETKLSRQTNKISYEKDTMADQKLSTTTVKYKILKVKHGYRRSGKRAIFIQEEAPESVAIVNLGNGAIPQFRLPLTRRQYMENPLDIGAFGDEDELPPPPINDSFISTEIDDIETTVLPQTTTVAEHRNDTIFLL